jgi:hypothetical protein
VCGATHAFEDGDEDGGADEAGAGVKEAVKMRGIICSESYIQKRRTKQKPKQKNCCWTFGL